ncbi:: zinc_ribbon_5 [Gemmata massiliana]|uniref:: zinc_ribbon_5 n=1 Tax=Gemmata massiliana TaxID=1210884 RepID=A0A6P2DD79_9BACT|nr:zinc-ribbon domain-containing protein [Gemmata massiliana]VTR99312.1 : zinc_ribbon_5 [Gemmata massiliana]
MPTVTEIPCPNCDTTLKVPDTVLGKKIKCKHCGHPFVAEEPEPARPAKSAKPAKPAKPGGVGVQAKKPEPKKEEPKPADAPYKFQDDDDDDGGAKPNPLGVIAESDVARCPHCAQELDPPDAKVCIHCGFNNVTREKAEQKKVWAPEFGDYMNHLGPGIIGLIICVALIVLDAICLLNMRDWMTGTFLESEQADPTDPSRKAMLVKPGAFITLIWAATIMPIIRTGRFAVKRLAIDNKPLERLKK